MVVSDAGPLIHLAQISQLPLLHKLFGVVLITPTVKFEVCDEGTRLGYPDAEDIAKALDAEWLKVEPFPKKLVASARKLAEGENISKADAQTLLLAVDKKAQVLVDEKLLSSLAKMYGLKVWSTWTVLLEALSRSHIAVSEVEVAVEELGTKKFKLNMKQAQEILDAARFIEKQKKKPNTLQG
jgi:predicted nucleic acid-binding protein